jgi:pyruvate dehydrogenase E1 component alpha subunit
MSLLSMAPLAGEVEFRLAAEQSASAYAAMLVIRRFEEKLGQLVAMGLIESTAQLTTYRECIPVAVAMALQDGEAFVASTSPYGALLALDAEPAELCASVLRGVPALSGSKRPELHLALDATSALRIAAGIAEHGTPVFAWVDLCAKPAPELSTEWERVVRNGLPVVLVATVPADASGKEPDAAGLAPFPIADGAAPVEAVNAVDFSRTFAACARAIGRARRGEGASLVLARTMAYQGHAAAARGSGAKAQVREDIDPIARARACLIEERITTEAALKALEKDVRDRVSGAISTAKDVARAV